MIDYFLEITEKNLITLAALISAVVVTSAVAATASSPGTEGQKDDHQVQAMGTGHGRMHGMLGSHEAGKESGQSKGTIHGKNMAACDR